MAEGRGQVFVFGTGRGGRKTVPAFYAESRFLHRLMPEQGRANNNLQKCSKQEKVSAKRGCSFTQHENRLATEAFCRMGVPLPARHSAINAKRKPLLPCRQKRFSWCGR